MYAQKVALAARRRPGAAARRGAWLGAGRAAAAGGGRVRPREVNFLAVNYGNIENTVTVPSARHCMSHVTSERDRAIQKITNLKAEIFARENLF